MFPILEVAGLGMKLLKGLGIIKDPEEEKAYQLKLIELAQSKDIKESEEFAAFLKATSPDAQYVPSWINALTASTRPLITWIILGSIISSFFIEGLAPRITATLQAFASAGTAGLLMIAIPAWWFFGRSIEKIVPGLGALGGNGNGDVKPTQAAGWVSPPLPARTDTPMRPEPTTVVTPTWPQHDVQLQPETPIAPSADPHRFDHVPGGDNR